MVLFTNTDGEMVSTESGELRDGPLAEYIYVHTGSLDSFNVNKHYEIETMLIEYEDGVANTGFAWNKDGSKVFSHEDDGVREYNLSTNYDTRTRGQSLGFVSTPFNTRGLQFNNDGSKMYVVDATTDLSFGSIVEYTLDTPFDLSSESGSSSYNLQDIRSHDVAWNDDGTKLYEAGLNDSVLTEMSLSTPWDLSTLSGVEHEISSQSGGPRSLEWSESGSILLELSGGNDSTLFKYEAGTPFDLSSVTYTGESRRINNNIGFDVKFRKPPQY